jgi:hypothetical protein
MLEGFTAKGALTTPVHMGAAPVAPLAVVRG